MESLLRPLGNAHQTAPKDQMQQHIDNELSAMEAGELRSEAQVRALFELLPNAQNDQLARAEKLQLALLINGRPLEKLPSLGVFVHENENGTKDIEYYELKRSEVPLAIEELNPKDKNSVLFTDGVEKKYLGIVHDARLVSPNFSALKLWPDEVAASRVDILRQDNARVTYHHGIPATWDARVDVKAWSTNIDTVYFSDWLRKSGALNSSVRVAAELGCGIGGISQVVLSECKNLERHLYTDIDPNAINATRRNLKPLTTNQQVSWAIGKGLEGLVSPGTLDLLVTNPPYIPNPNGVGDVDHYSGTNLVRRIFSDGIPLLNPHNPEAAIYVQMSSVTLPDFIRYQKEFPNVQVELIGEPVQVPLRILGLLLEPKIMEFLEKQGGLTHIPNDPMQYYHQIMAFKLSPKR